MTEAERNERVRTRRLELIEAASLGKRVYAYDHRGHVEVVKVAFRKGQRAEKGHVIMNPEWTHACVEGDLGWTDLTTGEFKPEGDRKYTPDP